VKKNFLFIIVSALVVISGYSQVEITEIVNDQMNPFLSAYNTPFNVPPFDIIKNEHFLPAIKQGITEQQAEIEAISLNPKPPTFENTIEMLDGSGKLLGEVSMTFNNLQGVNTSDELQNLAKQASPLFSAHRDDILLNEKLFLRIKTVYEQKEKLSLTAEQQMLLEKTYKRFVRNGANLNAEQKDKLRKLNEELSMLSLTFDENILAETNAFQLIIKDKKQLKGLPEGIIQAAAEAAKEAGLEGKWLFTVQKPSMIPFLQYADDRSLREKIFKAYINRGDNNNKYDNKAIASKEASLRFERATLLGYKSHADYILEENMAKNPESVYKFLDKVMEPALKMAKTEVTELQTMINAEGGKFKLEAWDWWYYAEKLKMQKYDLDEEALRPYFKMENVLTGMFGVANKLFGLQFKELSNMPIYQEDVKVYEVLEADGSHVGILYMDFYPRASKSGGAWMTNFREQYKKYGEKIPPVILMATNFSKPTADKPALLNYEEVSTLYHEFGHALHGLLSDCTYETISGTAVSRDFVELPSQIMENWAGEPEVMKTYAFHYKTGEVIPQELMDKMKNSRHFNQGFTTVEYLSAAFLDMDWHTLKTAELQNAISFENASMKRIGLIPEIVVRYRTPYFSHIFAGGYSAGYYAYIWAEILDADAFEAFSKKGIFDPATALAFRKNILEKGGTEDPMKLYIIFRGQEPDINALLKRRGLIGE